MNFYKSQPTFMFRGSTLQRLCLLLCIAFATLFTSVSAQQRSVTGKVTDELGDPLPGVSIIVDGTTNGTLSREDGTFSIMALPEQTLVFKYYGKKTTSVLVGTQASVNLTLEEGLEVLDEVVVIGYGTVKKSDVISSVASVKPENMTKVATSDIGEMLRGKVAGVQVTLSDGGPGSSSNILIRGQNSINGGNAPLVVVGGVPAGNINDINPNDIASLEILKDAAAQSIYGARAANGVILITTKRGKDGVTSVNYNGNSGFQNYNRNFDIYSGEEFAQLKREAFRSANLGVYPQDEAIMSDLELYSVQSGNYIDWEKEILRNGSTQNHNVSIATGSKNTNVYTSVQLFNQTGVVANSDYNRVTARVNLDQTVKSWLKIGMNTSFQYSKENSPNVGSVLLTSITTSPLGKIYNDDGTLRYLPGGFEENKNPLIDINETNTESNNRNDIINAFLDFSPIKGFNYRLNLSRRSWNGKYLSYNTGESITGVTNGGLGRGNINFQDNVEWQIENIVSYKKTFGSGHNLSLTGVQSVIESKYNQFQIISNDLPNDILGIYGLESATTNTPYIAGNRRGLVSIAGKAEYNYNSRYYLTLSTRADASTVFGANNKWGYFPALGVGWNIQNESFMQNVKAIYNLKLRATYGSVGNEGIAPYQSQSTALHTVLTYIFVMSSSIAPYQSQSTALQRDYLINGVKVSGYVPGDFLPNPELRWETSTTANLALDFGLFENRISGTFEVYNTRTSDLLIDQALNASSGYSRKKTNLGEVQNQGIEVTLNTSIIRKKDFNFNVSVLFTKNENKILHLYGLDENGDGIEDDDIGNRWFIGQPIQVYYQYQPVGIFQEGEDIASSHQPTAKPGDIKLFDRFPDDGILNAANDRVLTKAGPNWYGTLSLNLNYKFIDFSADINTVQGVTRYNTFLVGYSEGGSLRGIKNGIKQNYWTPENPGGNFPRPNEANDPNNLFTLALQDASYTRLQNVSIGFSLPQKTLTSIGMSRLRLYFTGSNLITVTDYQSYSPEKNPNEYPEARTVIVGLQAGF